MNSTVASAPWSRAAGTPAAPWSLGRSIDGDGGRRVEWLLKRNCSITPRQLFAVYLSLCVVSLLIALAFTWHGAAPVLAFAAVELVLVGSALLIYARHAADHERITLAGSALSVEHQFGAHTERVELRAPWVRVEPLSSDRSLIEVASDGRRARVGRYLRPELRPWLARELRAALRSQPRPDAESFSEELATKRQR
jgi:uncharacterized membrane protein